MRASRIREIGVDTCRLHPAANRNSRVFIWSQFNDGVLVSRMRVEAMLHSRDRKQVQGVRKLTRMPIPAHQKTTPPGPEIFTPFFSVFNSLGTPFAKGVDAWGEPCRLALSRGRSPATSGSITARRDPEQQGVFSGMTIGVLSRD